MARMRILYHVALVSTLLSHSDALWHMYSLLNCVIITLGNGSSPFSIKPLPKSMMTYWDFGTLGKIFSAICMNIWIFPSDKVHLKMSFTWWRHQMETFSALQAICAGNSPVPVNSPHKGQWRGTLMFSLICARRNGWVNNGEAGDLRRSYWDAVLIMTSL